MPVCFKLVPFSDHQYGTHSGVSEFWFQNVSRGTSATVRDKVQEEEDGSLVSRLSHSRTRILKLCRWGEPGISSHVSTIKGRKGVERPALNRKKSEGSA